MNLEENLLRFPGKAVLLNYTIFVKFPLHGNPALPSEYQSAGNTVELDIFENTAESLSGKILFRGQNIYFLFVLLQF